MLMCNDTSQMVSVPRHVFGERGHKFGHLFPNGNVDMTNFSSGTRTGETLLELFKQKQ